MHIVRTLTAVTLATAVTALSAPTLTAAAEPAAASSVYLVQGVTGSSWSLSVDGEEVAEAEAKEVLGPYDWPAGTHTVTATDGDGEEVTATVEVSAGESLDVVLHRPVDPTGAPLFTTFENDLAPVKDGSGRLTVAHTAAAPPADIRVDGDVLLADVASAEEITTVVPTGVYPVDIVPTATEGPVVMGPVDLEVAEGALTRVFAIGVAADQTMDAVVQVLPLPKTDASAPTSVPAGDGSLASGSGTAPGAWLLAVGAVLLVVGGRRLRRP
ncbi:DUF4397 domain-containing protein [uncultured Nocardioides sp.]|uniref:DUF4397 domain-containing protein n=1 Tax=uncultured Nocardioides sp. TaxID=198441 RepID=UPI0025D3A09B|nr:DUF4397 domain-containing protein [uncultured Nocardioides sp.]